MLEIHLNKKNLKYVLTYYYDLLIIIQVEADCSAIKPVVFFVECEILSSPSHLTLPHSPSCVLRR